MEQPVPQSKAHMVVEDMQVSEVVDKCVTHDRVIRKNVERTRHSVWANINLRVAQKNICRC